MKRVNWNRMRVIAALLTAVTFMPLVVQAAAPAFPALGSSVMAIPFHISGANTATVASIVQFNAPFNLRLLYATMSFSAKSGSLQNSHGNSILTVLNNGVAAMTMDLLQPAAGAVQEATPVTAQLNVAKDNPVTANLTLWGSSPSVSNLTVVIWVQRRS